MTQVLNKMLPSIALTCSSDSIHISLPSIMRASQGIAGPSTSWEGVAMQCLYWPRPLSKPRTNGLLLHGGIDFSGLTRDRGEESRVSHGVKTTEWGIVLLPYGSFYMSLNGILHFLKVKRQGFNHRQGGKKVSLQQTMTDKWFDLVNKARWLNLTNDSWSNDKSLAVHVLTKK